MTPQNGKFIPETNVPAIIALQFAQGTRKDSLYKDKQGNPKVEFCFTLTNGQKWYAPEAVANEIQRHGVVANQPLQVTRRENGTIDVKPLAQASIAQPQYAPAAVVQNIYRAPEPPPPPQWEPGAASSAPAPVAPAERFMSAYKTAIDILLEAQVYAKRQGLLLEIKCEDARALAATIMIDAQKRGGC